MSSTPLVCVSLDLNLYYDIGSKKLEGLDSNIALPYAKHIPTLRVISMLISHSQHDIIRLPWDPEVDPTTWWIVTRVGPSVDLVAVKPNEGQSMKRMYNEEIFADGMT